MNEGLYWALVGLLIVFGAMAIGVALGKASRQHEVDDLSAQVRKFDRDGDGRIGGSKPRG